MIERLICPLCSTPLVHCEHVHSVRYKNGQIERITLTDGRKVYRADIPVFKPIIPALDKPIVRPQNDTH